MWYLHGPDRTTPYEVTLKAVNDLYKEGCVFSTYAPKINSHSSPSSDYLSDLASVILHRMSIRDAIGLHCLTFFSWEVAEIVGICKANGYIQPTAYQGLYNAIHR